MFSRSVLSSSCGIFLFLLAILPYKKGACKEQTPSVKIALNNTRSPCLIYDPRYLRQGIIKLNDNFEIYTSRFYKYTKMKGRRYSEDTPITKTDTLKALLAYKFICHLLNHSSKNQGKPCPNFPTKLTACLFMRKLYYLQF